MAWTRDAVADVRELRGCVRDLVALSSMPAWWVGRSPDAIAESLRDLLVSVLRSDRVFVQLTNGDGARNRRATARAVPHHDSREVQHATPRIENVAPDSAALAALRFVSYPIGLDGEMGRFAVGCSRPDFPTELESLLMHVTANEVAAALRQATLLLRHQEAVCALRARVNQQDAGARLGQLALTGVPLRELFDEGVRVVLEALEADCCELLELTPDGTMLVLTAGAGWTSEMVGQTRVPCDASSQEGYTLQTGAPVIVEDLRTETRFGVSLLLRDHGIVSGISVILHDAERPFGVLGAHTRTRRVFTSDDAHFVQSTANLLSVALQRHRAESEREQLLARTTVAHAEAERVSRGKTQHLALMSHELRTPLNAIAGYVEMMEMGIHGPLTDAQRADLSRIRHNQRYLTRLLNSVLTFMKLEGGFVEYDLTDVSITEMLAAVEELIRPLMQAKRLRYEIHKPECEVWVRADGSKLQQILVNLLTNATKFTEAEGVVEVDCATDEHVVRTHVRDSGCGIPHGELERVFEPFVQVKDVSAGMSEGTGLGLAISRQFAEGMQGRLYADSEKGKGSVFTLELPRSI